MTIVRPRQRPEAAAPSTRPAYELIICRDDRIVLHEHYDSAQLRLSTCVSILTASDVLTGTIDAERAARIHTLHHQRFAQWRSEPDQVLNALAKLCRTWNVQIYVGTTTKQSAAPRVLYSVITMHGSGQAVAEHFPDRASRTAGLVERAERFFDAPGRIPEEVLSDELRLAALVTTFLMPAAVVLTEAVLDEDDGVYRPAGGEPPVR